YWVVQAGLNPLQLVLLGTALEGTLFVLQIPTGAFADSFGRRPATVIGYALMGAGLGLQALTRDFVSLLALQVLTGAAWTFLIGSIEAWIADRAGTDHLERVFLRGGQAEMVGLMGGLVMTIFLAQIDARLSILTGGLLLVGVSGMAAALMQESRPASPRFPRSRWHELMSVASTGLLLIRRSRVLMMLVIVTVILGASSEGWDRLYAAHLMRDLGLAAASRLTPAGWLALIGLVQSAAGVIVFQLAATRIKGTHPGATLGAIYLSQAALMLGFAVLGSLPLAVAAFLTSQGFRRLGEPLVDAWISRQTPPEVRATVLSVVGQADSLGQLVAGPAVGAIGSAVSISAALGVSAALLLPAAVLAAAAERLGKSFGQARQNVVTLDP
ncbi:MAG TPA: MFS transporter, partial [Candidatus Dormibacteraeota bacterium]|nr:MFS transporter [Candidatus Dormibacteraeota bacterium]